MSFMLSSQLNNPYEILALPKKVAKWMSGEVTNLVCMGANKKGKNEDDRDHLKNCIVT